jgi:hypothetical protein
MSSPLQSPASARANARPITLLVALALVALTLVVVILQMQPPPPRGLDAPTDVFSAQRAFAALKGVLAGGKPHPLGSAENTLVRERIIARMQALGYPVSVQETVSCRSGSGAYVTCAPIQNILAELPGQTDGPAVLLMAHYDSGAMSPGAADDGAGVAALLEIARIMQEHGPYRNPVLFLFPDGEERGLLGAQAFMQQHPWAKRVGVVINQEARGTAGQSLMFETSANNAWLIEAYAASVPHPLANSLSYEVYRNLPNDTDLTIFKDAGVAGMNLAFIEQSVHYHMPLDNLKNLDQGSLQHQGESVLAVARTLAMRDLANPPAGDAAYTEIMGLVMLRWPAAWTLPLAVLALVLPVAVAVALVLRRRLAPAALGWGMLAGLFALVVPVVLGVGLTWLVSTVAGTPTPWYAYPLPMRLALWAGAFLGSGLAAVLLGRRAGPWGFGLAAWSFWALLALFLALTVPGAAIMLLVPTLWAGLFLAVVGFTPLAGVPLAREIALIAAALGATLFGLALALRLETAMGLIMSPLITLPVALVTMTLLPFLALSKGQARLRTGFVLLAAAVMVAGTIAALLVPPYSADAPQVVNLYHVEDRDAGTASWTALAAGSGLPAGLRQLYDADPQAVFPWTQWRSPVAQANVTSTPDPGLEVLSDEHSGGGRTVQVRLRAARGEDELDLLMPITTTESITMGGQTFAANPKDSRNGFYSLWCYACDGQEVTLRFKSADPVEVLVAEYTSGLPAGAERFVQARPAWALAAYDGDLTVVVKRVELP